MVNWSYIAQTPIFAADNQHCLIQMASQATWPPELPADSLEIWESGNSDIWKLGIPQNPKMKIIRMNIRPAQNVCMVLISRNTNHPAPFLGHFM